MSIDMDAYGERPICEVCIAEDYLARKVAQSEHRATCFYCSEEDRLTWQLSELAECVETAFEQHYRRTSDEPNALQSMMLRDKEGTYDFERDGDQTIWAIQAALNCTEAVADDLQKYLGEKHSDWDAALGGYECEFDEEAHYEEIMPSDGDWHQEWHRFERELKSETRFFSQSAHSYLTSIFGGLETMQTSSGDPVIIVAGPPAEGGNEPDISGFYRARVFYSEKQLADAMKRPDLELAPPPSNFARAGRMNAHGVSVFYGADSAEGAIAEVRPPVGSQTLMGRFDLLRTVRLLDFSALRSVREVGSIFDPQHADRLARAQFLRSLKYRINRPVMPTDEEFEYLATQAVIDFLANGLPVDLDGVLFPSAQTNETSVNVVLFHRSSTVRKLDLPKGTEISAHTYMSTNEGPEPDYRVHEEVPSQDEQEKLEAEAAKYPGLMRYMNTGEDSGSEPTLCLDIESLQVIEVAAASYASEIHSIRRHRSEKRSNMPF